MVLALNIGKCTLLGNYRENNEDAIDVKQFSDLTLCLVADGMGGHAAGEVASEMAVQIVMREIKDVSDLSDGSATKMLGEALKLANRAIHDRTITEVDKQGMGTTASVLVLAESRYLIGQVGDSRVYLLRDGALKQLTKDHSYVQEQVDLGNLTPEQARYHPYSNVITRCVGASPDVEPPSLERRAVRGRRQLAIRTLRGEPGFDVVFAGRARTEIAGGNVNHPVGQFQLVEEFPFPREQLLMLVLGRFRRGVGEHLDLVEPMHPDDAVGVFPIRAGLSPETRREPRVAARQ